MSTARDLQSKQRARILDLICEGKVAGLCDAAGNLLSFADRNKGIMLELTPIKNADDSAAIPNVVTDFRPGSAHQTHITGFPSAEQEIPVEAQVIKGSDKWTNAVQREIATGSHNAIRVSVRIPALYNYDDKGARSGAQVHFSIQIKLTTESEWQEIVGSNPDGYGGIDGLIQGEALTPYVREYRIPLNGDGPWDVRIGRETPDSADPTKLQNELWWQSYTLITDEKLTFRHSCVGAVEFDAEQQSRIMSRGYRLKGMLVRVPSNYDPDTRNYSGVWDGKFAGCDLTLSGDYTAGATSLPVNAIAAALPDNSLVRFTVGTTVLEAYLNGDHDAGATSLTVSPIPQSIESGAEGFGYHLKWTNNPAWIYFDVATAKRYGAGSYIREEAIDKWGLYSIARYCDGVDSEGNFVGVSDGNGGYEPRFACSVYIASQAEAWRVISDLATVFRAMVYWGAGFITAVQDSPKTPSFTFTNANVVDGIFTYSGTAQKARHTVVNVQWNDPDDYSRAKIEPVEAGEEVIDRLGYREINVAGFGCASRSQAIRIGKWLLLTEEYENQTVSFRGGLEVARARPGMIIRVRDRLKTVTRMGGRVKTVGSEALELDTPLTIGENGGSLIVTKDDGSTAELTITTGASTVSIVEVSGDVSGISPNAIWVFRSDDLEPTLWRVLNVKELEDHVFEVTGLQYVADKFDAVEQGVAINLPRTSDLPLVVRPASVDSITVTETIASTAEKSDRFLNISWTAATGSNVRGYRVEMRAPGKEWTLLIGFTTALSVPPIVVAPLGAYEFRVTTLGYYKLESFPTTITYALGEAAAPAIPADFTVAGIAGGFRLAWTDALKDRGYYRIYISATSTKPANAYTLVTGGLSEWSITGFSLPVERFFWLEPVLYRINLAGTSAGPSSATSLVEGGYVDYIFQRAADQPATPTGNGLPAGWSDGPPTGTSPLWMSSSFKSATDVLLGAWSDPTRLDAPQTKVEYSVDGSTSWHSSPTDADYYMRISTDDGASWGAALKIRGEDGEDGEDGNDGSNGANGSDGSDGRSAVTIYVVAAEQPDTPTGNNPSGWSTSIPSGVGAVWASTGTKTLSGTLVGSWSTPERISGSITFAQTGDPTSSYTVRAGDIWFDTTGFPDNVRIKVRNAANNAWTDNTINQLAVSQLLAGTIQAIAIVIASGGTVSSSNFVSGTSGFRINGNGDVEFRNGKFTGVINASFLDHATIFMRDPLSDEGGQLRLQMPAGDDSFWNIDVGDNDRLRFFRDADDTIPAEFICDLYANDFVELSSRKLKKDVKTITGALQSLMAIRGVRFRWRKNTRRSDAVNFGVIAEEVEEIFPECVRTDATGRKAVTYTKLVPVLIEALRETSVRLTDAEGRIRKLESELAKH